MLVDAAEKAIITWTTHVDLPEKVEDLKPATLRPVGNRLTLRKNDIGDELIIDMKNPATDVGAVSTVYGNVFVLFSALLMGVVASFGAWVKAPPTLYGVFLTLVVAATGFAVYRGYVHGWSEALSTLGGVTGAGTIVFNLLLIGFAIFRKWRIATVMGDVTAAGKPVRGVKMALENSAGKTIAHATSDHDGKYEIVFWPKNSAEHAYSLKTTPGFAESWQRGVKLGARTTERADVELRLFDVLGSWDLNHELTQSKISESLIRAAGDSLKPEDALRIATELQAELRYPSWISVQRDNLVQAAESRSGKWEASPNDPGKFDITIADVPALELMQRSGGELVLRGREAGVLAAVYAPRAVIG